MKKFFLRYKFALALLLVSLTLLIINPAIGQKSFSITWSNVLDMMSVVPPIFIMLGLLDVWINRDTMIKLMGDNSGFIGIILAFFLGSAAAGPLYAAFPVAGVLLKKGSKLSNVLIFIGAWSTIKIPMLMFEASSLGWKFMITRFIIDIPGIALIAIATAKALNPTEREQIYNNAVAQDY